MQPKQATAAKASAGATRGARGGRGARGDRGGRGGRTGRGKPKTAEELDAEMKDYFVVNTNSGDGAAEGAAATNSGDQGMDGISVG